MYPSLPRPSSPPTTHYKHKANHANAIQVLQDAHERVIRTPDDDEPSVQVPLGLYLVRGDNVCTVGLVDDKLDESIDWTAVKGSAIGGVKHV